MKKNSEKYFKTAPKYGKIMGINVISTSTDQVLANTENFIAHNTQFYIVTPNPELVLMAQGNPELLEALNHADLPVPDGVGLKLAIPDLKIIKGRELFDNLIKLAYVRGWKVFLLGGLGKEASLAESVIKEKYKGVKISSHKGPRLNQNGDPVTEVDRKLEKDIVDKTGKFAPDLLFVAFGNPKQEIWIHKNISKLKIKGAMAVGGTFRYVSGIAKLPPKWIERLGLEWLYRLFTEPVRLKRIWNAVVVFPWKLLLFKLNILGKHTS